MANSTYNLDLGNGTVIPIPGGRGQRNALIQELLNNNINRGSNQYRQLLRDYDDWVELQRQSNNTGSGWGYFSNGISGANSLTRTLGDGYDDFLEQNIKLSEEWNKVDQKASEFAKAIGLGAKGMAEIRNLAISFGDELKLGTRFNLSDEEALELMQQYDEALGRRVGVNGEGMETLAAESSIFGKDTATKLTTELESFGVSLESTGKYASKMYADAAKSGLSLKKLSDNFVNNMKMADKYNFKDGIMGLERMAKKSLEIGMNMEVAASVSEKMITEGIEGAVEMGAKLQVLGGPFAQFGNPLSMLSNGLLDMESMQDQIGQMVSQLSSFNRTTGELEMTMFDKMRLRQAAASMGVSYDDLVSSAKRQGLRAEITRQMGGNDAGFNYGSAEAIKNVGVIKNGVAGANIDGVFRSLEEIRSSDELQRKIAVQGVDEKDNIADIAMNVRSIYDYFTGNTKQVQARMARWQRDSGMGEHEKNNVARDYMSSEWYQMYSAAMKQGNRFTGIAQAGVDFSEGVTGSLRKMTSGELFKDENWNFIPFAAAGLTGTGLISGTKNILFDNQNWYGNEYYESPFSGVLPGSNVTNQYSFMPTPVSSTETNPYIAKQTYQDYYISNMLGNNTNNTQEIQIDPVDLNITGNIKLEGDGYSGVNINELMKDESFRRSLSELIAKTWNEKKGVF